VKAIAGGAKLEPLTKQIAADAEDAAKLFASSFADPKQLAASVSGRGDVVLFGSAPGEKWVGGKTVAATLAGWKLSITAHDGIAAGVTHVEDRRLGSGERRCEVDHEARCQADAVSRARDLRARQGQGVASGRGRVLVRQSCQVNGLDEADAPCVRYLR